LIEKFILIKCKPGRLEAVALLFDERTIYPANMVFFKVFVLVLPGLKSKYLFRWVVQKHINTLARWSLTEFKLFDRRAVIFL